jgi:hypothetical protein
VLATVKEVAVIIMAQARNVPGTPGREEIEVDKEWVEELMMGSNKFSNVFSV